MRFEVSYREADPRLREKIDQANAVDIENKKHYEPCITYFLEKFDPTKLEVIGLLVGARGTIPKFFVNFCKKFKLPNSMIKEIIISVVRGSNTIAHNHLYNMDNINS